MGEVPAPPTTGAAPLFAVLQPTMLSTVMLMLPAGGGELPPPVPSSTWLMKACRNPSSVTAPPPRGRLDAENSVENRNGHD